ncbi:MAG TPA: hypothetical protein VFW44_19270, partial [Bryobacteraceae bacterium]|nr:hypothetical protein [Bryobacteraceae bacterium]
MRKHATIGQKLSVSFGVVLVLAGLLTVSSVDTLRRLGGLLDTVVNENAKSADLADSIRVRLREMKEYSTSTQFSYSVDKVLQVNSSKAHNARSLGGCSVCHAFGTPAENRAGFAKLAQQASHDAELLTPLIHSESSKAALTTIRGSIQEWQADFDRYIELISAGNFADGHALVKDTMAPLKDKIEAATNQL